MKLDLLEGYKSYEMGESLFLEESCGHVPVGDNHTEKLAAPNNFEREDVLAAFRRE